MRTGIKLGPRAAAFVAVLIAASAVGILTPTLSNTVSKDVQVTGFAVTLTVDGIPDSVAPGGVFSVIATLANNANRPVPAVLRMEVRNPNNTVPDELTVYSQCGAEEVVSGTRLIYYIGWHGPSSLRREPPSRRAWTSRPFRRPSDPPNTGPQSSTKSRTEIPRGTSPSWLLG